MSTPKSFVALAAGLLLSGGSFAAGGALKSGPRPGEKLPGGFSPVNVTNAARPSLAGTRADYTEQHGADPVVLVFARQHSRALEGLAKELSAAAGRNCAARLRAVVVVLSEGAGVEEKLKALGRKEGAENVSLAYMAPDGAKGYKLAEAADVTVVMYRRRKVEAARAFRKGELDAKAAEVVGRDARRLASRATRGAP
jgi:hypothetical protein